MDATVLAVIAAFAVAASVIVVERRRAEVRLRDAADALAVARDELDRVRRTTADAREIRDLILSSMQDGVVLLDASGTTAYANAALERLLGARPTGTSGLFPLAIREVAERAAADGAAGSAVVETGTPARWLRVHASPAGDQGSVLLVVRDETDARRLDAIRRDFVANASHELKTPAASIRAAAETLRRSAEDDPGAVPRFAGQLEREAVRLSRIVADLLDLSRLESGSDLAERVHLDAIVREEVQRFEDRAADAGVHLEVDAPGTAAVRGSARDLSLLVRNLLDNAIRYTAPGGSVSASIAPDVDGSAVIAIRDTGVGIPQRELSRIFERFYRVDRARARETGGTGLGLAIVKHVAENHGGGVTVESELGAGTTVEVRLPRDGGDHPGGP